MKFRAPISGGNVGGSGAGRGAGNVVPFFLCVMEFPCDGVEETDQAGFADSAAEERIGGECAEGIVTNFSVCW
jgi:hypothetical protein